MVCPEQVEWFVEPGRKTRSLMTRNCGSIRDPNTVSGARLQFRSLSGASGQLNAVIVAVVVPLRLLRLTVVIALTITSGQGFAILGSTGGVRPVFFLFLLFRSVHAARLTGEGPGTFQRKC